MSILPALQKLLDENDVEYEILHHPADYRATVTAEDTHTPPAEFAKAVFLWIDGGYAVAALPATHFVAPSRMARAIGAEEIRLASEFEMADLVEIGQRCANVANRVRLVGLDNRTLMLRR